MNSAEFSSKYIEHHGILSDSENSLADQSIVTGLGPITVKVVNDLVVKMSNGGLKEKLISKYIDPVTEIINVKIQPYIYVGLGLYMIVIILFLVVIYLLLIKK